MKDDEKNLMDSARELATEDLTGVDQGEKKMFPNLNLAQYSVEAYSWVPGYTDLVIIDTYHDEYRRLLANAGGDLSKVEYDKNAPYLTSLNTEQVRIAIMFGMRHRIVSAKNILVGVAQFYPKDREEVRRVSEELEAKRNIGTDNSEPSIAPLFQESPKEDDKSIGDSLKQLSTPEFVERVPPEHIKDYLNTINKMTETIGG